jgi:hypothetical protein
MRWTRFSRGKKGLLNVGFAIVYYVPKFSPAILAFFLVSQCVGHFPHEL